MIDHRTEPTVFRKVILGNISPVEVSQGSVRNWMSIESNFHGIIFYTPTESEDTTPPSLILAGVGYLKPQSLHGVEQSR